MLYCSKQMVFSLLDSLTADFPLPRGHFSGQIHPFTCAFGQTAICGFPPEYHVSLQPGWRVTVGTGMASGAGFRAGSLLCR